MRVSESFTQSTYFRNLENVRAKYQEALRRMSTQERVYMPSDDPEAAAELATLSDETQKLAARRNAISQSRPYLQSTEESVTQLGTALQSALTYAVQGSSTILQQGGRQALAQQVAGLRKQVSGLANVAINGHYIFSGTKTDTQPYAADGSYQGNENSIQIPLDQGTATLNIPGDQVFGSAASGPIKLLADLENALQNGTETDVQALLDPLKAAVQANSATLSKIGNYRSALEAADARIADRQLSVQTRATDLGAADLAQAISDVSQFQQAQQATLAAGAKLYGPTFFDYLG